MAWLNGDRLGSLGPGQNPGGNRSFEQGQRYYLHPLVEDVGDWPH